MLLKVLAASALAVFTLPVLAASCEITVDSTDQMTFGTKAIEVSKSCKAFSVTLTHSGTLPVQVMGHNWVLSKAADVRGVAGDGMSAGVEEGYLPANDPRVIAHTRLIGAGDRDTVVFDTSTLDPGTQYTFFCSFPGHTAMMQGSFKLVD